MLAHEKGGGGHRVLQALRLPPNSIQNFVLENDPVPRALLSVDPTFEMLKEWSAVKGLLQLRGLIAGEGSPLSPGRFLYEAVGQVQLIKWTPEGGMQVFFSLCNLDIVLHEPMHTDPLLFSGERLQMVCPWQSCDTVYSIQVCCVANVACWPPILARMYAA